MQIARPAAECNVHALLRARGFSPLHRIPGSRQLRPTGRRLVVASLSPTITSLA